MSLTALRDALPAYAADQQVNIDVLSAETLLTEQQKWGCFLACAYATGVAQVIKAIEADATSRLSADARVAAKSAATVMAMNTVYYRAINLLNNHDYRAAPAHLSMLALSQAGVDKIDFELWALAVSAVHGCGSCLNAHESDLHKRGVSLERIQAALRIASTVSAVAATVLMEAAAA